MVPLRSRKIRLPVPNMRLFVAWSILGAGAAACGLGAFTSAPRNAQDLFAGVLFLTSGVATLAIAAYWFVGIPSVVVDDDAQTVSIRPFGPVLSRDQVKQIDAWSQDNVGQGNQITCRTLWKVNLVLVGEQEVRVWQGCTQEKARRLAQQLCDATGKPWVGGRGADYGIGALH